GAFRPTVAGLLWKVPWRLSVTRKANVRDRLKRLDTIIEAVKPSDVQRTALVCSLPTINF
ncbi:hypothetical protein BJY52DRAFT_1120043, partial [Lactarius psammicola]